MDEQRVLELIRQEFDRNYRSGTPAVPPHTHNGVDNLQILASDLSGSIPGGISDMWVFTSNGTFNVPEADYGLVIAVGGGQGGGHASGSDTVGTPGKSGDYVKSVVSFSGLSTVSVQIGAGGAGATSGGLDGANGGDTSFGGYVVAKGGNSATTSIGDFVLTGFTSLMPSLRLSATGSSTNVSQVSQPGGSNPLGQGGTAAFGAIGGAAAGNNGQGYGSGASGGAPGTGGGAIRGGDGKDGVLIVIW